MNPLSWRDNDSRIAIAGVLQRSKPIPPCVSPAHGATKPGLLLPPATGDTPGEPNPLAGDFANEQTVVEYEGAQTIRITLTGRSVFAKKRRIGSGEYIISEIISATDPLYGLLHALAEAFPNGVRLGRGTHERT